MIIVCLSLLKLVNTYSYSEDWNGPNVSKCCHPLGVIKFSMLTHTYPHNTPRKIKSDHMQSPGWQPTLCVAWCQIWWFASLDKSMVIHDTECPYWDQVSLNNTNPTQTQSKCLQMHVIVYWVQKSEESAWFHISLYLLCTIVFELGVIMFTGSFSLWGHASVLVNDVQVLFGCSATLGLRCVFWRSRFSQ